MKCVFILALGVAMATMFTGTSGRAWGQSPACVSLPGLCTGRCMSSLQEKAAENTARREEEKLRNEEKRRALAAPIKPDPEARLPCGDDALIDDGEDGDGLLLPRQKRNGRWYTTRGYSSRRVDAPGDSQFRMTDSGARGSRKAAALSCTGASESTGTCGLGFDFVAPQQPYDASAYGGIAFSARRGHGSAATVRLHLHDANTERESDICVTCGQHLEVPIVLAETWQSYTIPFHQFRPSASIGQAADRQPLLKGLYGLSWDITATRGQFELWIDDVRFTGCPAKNSAAWLFAKERTLHFQIDGDREVNDSIAAFGLLNDENACSTTDGTERCRYPSTGDGFILRSQGTHLVISLEPRNVPALLALLREKVGKALRVEIGGEAEVCSAIGALGLLDNPDACQTTNGVEMCNYPPTKEGYVLKSKDDHLEISFAF